VDSTTFLHSDENLDVISERMSKKHVLLLGEKGMHSMMTLFLVELLRK